MEVLVGSNFCLVCDEFDRDICFDSLNSVLKFLNSWNQNNTTMLLYQKNTDKSFVLQYLETNEWVISSTGFNTIEVEIFNVLLNGG